MQLLRTGFNRFLLFAIVVLVSIGCLVGASVLLPGSALALSDDGEGSSSQSSVYARAGLLGSETVVDVPVCDGFDSSLYAAQETGGDSAETSFDSASGMNGVDAEADASVTPASEDAASKDDSEGDQDGSAASGVLASSAYESQEHAETFSEGVAAETEDPLDDGWHDTEEGTVFVKGGVAQTGWLVDDTYGFYGLQRYWLDPLTTYLRRGALVTQEEAGWWAYARPEGYVVRGTYVTAEGNVYLANNDGKLEEVGWLVTGSYTGGDLQRYYIDADTHATCAGFFEVDGSMYYGYDTVGYVARGNVTCEGLKVSASNDGVLLRVGWLVTDAFGQGLQRYWVADSRVATSRLVDPSEGSGAWWAYATPEGYVVRGLYTAADGSIYLADNDGRLEDPGWLVTGSYTGGDLQRYYIDADSHACTLAFFTVGGFAYHANTYTGSVVRGKTSYGSGILLSNNDGVLCSQAGWLVTDVYDGHLERYWIDACCGGELGARVGVFVVEGRSYYAGSSTAYVARNITLASDSWVDNDGIIHVRGGTGWLVTDGLGAGLQRYWFANEAMAIDRLVDPSEGSGAWWAYATPRGYVVRGKWDSGSRVYLANNDGLLENPGWLVTDAYDGELQRYRIDEDAHACVGGIFMVGDNYYYGLAGAGYVLRGVYFTAGISYYADSDGCLALRVSSSVPTKEDGAESLTNSTFVNQTQYLFLPSDANLSQVTLVFESYAGADVAYYSFQRDGSYAAFRSGDLFDLTQAPLLDDARIVYVRTTENSIIGMLAVMLSANVASMFIVSDDPVNQGRAYIEASKDHSAKATGSLLMVDADGTVVYNQKLSQIKGRGNTTWHLSKKPYQIKLDKKCDLLETGDSANKAKTWILLANAQEATLLHNSIYLDLGLDMGLDTTTEYRPIDLYYDGEYRGSYLLTEKVEINSGRVDIYDLEKANEEANPGVDVDALPLAQGVNSYGYAFQYTVGIEDPVDISGGYLVEKDTEAYAKSERSWFRTSSGIFVCKAPESLSYWEMLYISNYVQSCINACSANSSQVKAYVDIDSFASVGAISDFVKVPDWNVSSSYYYLPSASDDRHENVLYAGPLWDGDDCMGVRHMSKNYWYECSYSGLKSEPGTGYPWGCSQAIQTALKDAYETRLSSLVSALLAESGYEVGDGRIKPVQSYVTHISASQKMNEALWGLQHHEGYYMAFPTYQENIDYMRDWLAARQLWFDTEVASWPSSNIHSAQTAYEGYDYGLVYDYYYYLETNPDVAAAYGGDEYLTLQHFVLIGMTEGRQGCRMFNLSTYRAYNPDLVAAFGEDLPAYYRHYEDYGFMEGRHAI